MPDKKDFKKDKPKVKPSSPWGLIIAIILISFILNDLGIGTGGEQATSTDTGTQDKPAVIIGK